MEQNNLEAQLNLHQEIDSEYGKITYSVNSIAVELELLLRQNTKGQEKDTFVFNIEKLTEMLVIANNLKQVKLNAIGNYCKDSYDKISQHRKLIQILNKKS